MAFIGSDWYVTNTEYRPIQFNYIIEIGSFNHKWEQHLRTDDKYLNQVLTN